MRSASAHQARTLVAAAIILSTALCAGEAPYGSQDFLPSPERPAGYRGDGSGIYPAAAPPINFSEEGKKNLLWVTKIPVVEKPGGWSHSPPLVVGKKVFVEAEPDSTLCLDADTGKILWREALGLLETPTGGWAMHSGNGYSTASSDGAAVYRLFAGKPKDGAKKGGAYLVSYDLAGKLRWRTEVKDIAALASPLIVRDKFIIGNAAYDTATGKPAWGPLKYEIPRGEPKPWSAGHNNDDTLVRVRLKDKDFVLYPGGWCVDPQDGKLLAKVLAMKKTDGRDWHPLGIAVWPFLSPVVRTNPDGSALVLFSGCDSKGLIGGAKGEAAVPVPPDADLTKPPWSDKQPGPALRVLACVLRLETNGEIRSEPLWPQPAALWITQSGHPWPHLSLCGERIAVSHIKGQLAVLDLKTGRLLGKDFQPVYNCEYKTAHLKYKLDAPEVVAAREEYNLTEELAFGKGGGRNMETSLARMGRTVYARTAVDSRNYLYLANRMHEVFVLELTDAGLKQVARNAINLPVCFFSHAAPVLQGRRLYYRTWGQMYCFEDSDGKAETR